MGIVVMVMAILAVVIAIIGITIKKNSNKDEKQLLENNIGKKVS